MTEDYTLTRIRKDVLKKLRAIAEANKRTVPSQIEWFVERAATEGERQFAPTPTQPETKEA